MKHISDFDRIQLPEIIEMKSHFKSLKNGSDVSKSSLKPGTKTNFKELFRFKLKSIK